MQTYRITTLIPGISEPFVDWFVASSESDALEQARAEAASAGIPSDATFSARLATDKEADAIA